MKLNLLAIGQVLNRPKLLIVIILGLALTVTGVETLIDDQSVSVFEFFFDTIEKALVITGSGGVFLILAQLRAAQDERKSLVQQLEVARTEGIGWRKKVQTFTNGLGVEIDKQFERYIFNAHLDFPNCC